MTNVIVSTMKYKFFICCFFSYFVCVNRISTLLLKKIYKNDQHTNLKNQVVRNVGF